MVAASALTGHGLEIGALHQPQWLPPGASADYCDCLTVEQQKQHYPELGNVRFTPLTFVADGEELQGIDQNTYDFIVANHFLEHCVEPTRTLLRLCDAVKPGGVLFLAVPDKRLTFDHRRPVTTMDHFRRDFITGGRSTWEDHLAEYVRLVDVPNGRDEEETKRHYRAIKYSFHVHVWDHDSLLDYLSVAAGWLDHAFRVSQIVRNVAGGETICVLEVR
jgi:SAM-dependent methyltransferase